MPSDCSFVALLIVVLALSGARPAAAAQTAHASVFAGSWVAEVAGGAGAAEKLARELGLRSLGQVRYDPLLHTCYQ